MTQFLFQRGASADFVNSMVRPFNKIRIYVMIYSMLLYVAVIITVLLSRSVLQLGKEVTVGDGCVVSVFCVLDKEDHLDNMTVVYGPGNQRRKQQDKPMVCV